jgi:hypothetical protein
VVCAKSLLSVLDHRQCCAGCGALTFKCAFAVLQQKRLVRRDMAFHADDARGDDLPDFRYGPS